MPYFASNDPNVTGCPRWGVVKEDGSPVPSPCYGNREDAIARAYAMNRAEGITTGSIMWESRDGNK